MARHITTQRHRALDIVFEAESKGILVPGLLRELLAERREISTAQVPIQDTGVRLVELVADHLYDLDEMIDSMSTWGLRRLSLLDRAVLRLGIVELTYQDAKVGDVISDYSDLVRAMGGDKSIPFLTAIFNKVGQTSTAAQAETESGD